MRGTLNLHLSTAEGALVRVLGTITRRGYSLRRVTAIGGDIPDIMDVTITVEGDRPIDRLVRQLEKLFEVRDVELSLAVPLRVAGEAM